MNIETYKPEYKEAFIAMNLAWIEEMFQVEDEDRMVLGSIEERLQMVGRFSSPSMMKARLWHLVWLHHSHLVSGKLKNLLPKKNLLVKGLAKLVCKLAWILLRRNRFKKLLSFRIENVCPPSICIENLVLSKFQLSKTNSLMNVQTLLLNNISSNLKEQDQADKKS